MASILSEKEQGQRFEQHVANVALLFKCTTVLGGLTHIVSFFLSFPNNTDDEIQR